MNTPTPDKRKSPAASGANEDRVDETVEHASDYLWDRSGPADPLVARLENVLAGSGLQRIDAPAPNADIAQAHGRPRRLFRPQGILSLAAVIALMLGIGVWYALREPVSGEGWYVDAVAGRPLADGDTLAPGGILGVKRWLVTDEGSGATVRVPRIGTVKVAGNSRLRIEESTESRHKVNLAHGRIEASINAPARVFFVETRAALATDMGCRYDLEMPKPGEGPGLLTVTAGWVLLEGRAAGGSRWEARVPRGVSCAIYETIGPGTPFFLGSKELKTRLDPFDRAGWQTITEPELTEILNLCGSNDGVTLWHLLHRVDASLRPMVWERLRVVLGKPPPLSSTAVVQLDEEAMERLWEEVR